VPLTDTLINELRAAAGPLTAMRAHVGDVDVRADTPPADGADPDLIFSGHAAVFDVRSEVLGGKYYTFVEIVQRGAFRKALDDNQDVVYLFDHAGLPLARTSGKSLELREDPRGLFVYARATPTTVAKDLAMAMRAGNVRQMSFAFSVAEDLWEEHNLEDGTTEVVRTIVKVDRLYDVSAVSHPAYPQTDAQVRSRDTGMVANRFGLQMPEIDLDGLREQLARSVGSPDEDEREARQARHRELVAGATRRLTLARSHTKTKELSR
jgi:HK97 family phage prohead protease